jgi:hypothetical protein
MRKLGLYSPARQLVGMSMYLDRVPCRQCPNTRRICRRGNVRRATDLPPSDGCGVSATLGRLDGWHTDAMLATALVRWNWEVALTGAPQTYSERGLSAS